MSKVRSVLVCSDCGQQLARWAGRCPGCGAWGTIEAQGRPAGAASQSSPVSRVLDGTSGPQRASTGYESIDRVLGAGIVPGSVMLLAGEPGIGKSTLLLQLVSSLSNAGRPCLLASGEESADQVTDRARRLGAPAGSVAFMSGRELPQVLEAALAERPFLLAIDSIQTLRDPETGGVVGGPGQVRACADALVGLAKSQNIAVLMTGHVTKDGDLAGPRTLEHAVDVVMSFEGDPRTGRRMLACGKNRFGQEGELAWFEMSRDGLRESDAGGLVSGDAQPGCAVALPIAGRRALAVEVQALAVPVEGGVRRQVTGLDPRRFQLIAAVVDRVAGIPLARSDLYGATSGGIRVDDPGCDLAVAAALASAATGVAPPPACAFVGELGLTGEVRPASSMAQRIAAARPRGVETVFAAAGAGAEPEVTGIEHVSEALAWARESQK